MHSSNMVEIDFITKATPGVIWTLKANSIQQIKPLLCFQTSVAQKNNFMWEMCNSHMYPINDHKCDISS